MYRIYVLKRGSGFKHNLSGFHLGFFCLNDKIFIVNAEPLPGNSWIRLRQMVNPNNHLTSHCMPQA